MPTFFRPIFKKTWKTLVALCGAILVHLRKRQKMQKKTIEQKSIHMPLESVSGAMWRYVSFEAFCCGSCRVI